MAGRMFVSMLLALAVVFVSAPTFAADDPEPGDEIKLTLHDGNVVQGMLIGTNDLGYRISFAGTEVIVHYTSVASVDVVTKEALLEEMRPGGPRSDAPSQSPTPPDPPAPPEGVEAPETVPPEPDGGAEVPEAVPSPSVDVPEPLEADEQPPLPTELPSNSEQLDEEPNQRAAEVPPMPPSRGGALMTTGFILVGAGAALAVSSFVLTGASFASNDLSDDDVVFPILTLTGGVMATVGVGLAVTGTVLKVVSGSRRRRWQKTYGDLQLTPLIGPGTGGLAVVGTF